MSIPGYGVRYYTAALNGSVKWVKEVTRCYWVKRSAKGSNSRFAHYPSRHRESELRDRDGKIYRGGWGLASEREVGFIEKQREES